MVFELIAEFFNVKVIEIWNAISSSFANNSKIETNHKDHNKVWSGKKKKNHRKDLVKVLGILFSKLFKTCRTYKKILEL